MLRLIFYLSRKMFATMLFFNLSRESVPLHKGVGGSAAFGTFGDRVFPICVSLILDKGQTCPMCQIPIDTISYQYCFDCNFLRKIDNSIRLVMIYLGGKTSHYRQQQLIFSIKKTLMIDGAASISHQNLLAMTAIFKVIISFIKYSE